MKKLAILFVLLFSALYGQSQIFKGMIIGGMNLSQVEGDEFAGFNRFGANVGAGVYVGLDKKWGLSMETLFSQKGSHQGQQYETVIDSLGNQKNGAYDLRLNYVEIPLIFHYTDRERMTVGLGVSYSRLVGVDETEHDIHNDATTVESGIYSKNNFDGLVDVRFALYKNLKLNARWSYSLNVIRTRTFTTIDGVSSSWTRDQRNHTISIRLIWVFNDNAMTISYARKKKNAEKMGI